MAKEFDDEEEIEQLRFSELIGTDYKGWKPGDSIILDGGTGSGKTYFCTKILGRHASKNNKKILYLCNRTELKRQIVSKINKCGLVAQFTVCTYQLLQSLLIEGKKIPRFDYIIVDEAHYFTMDAFNKYTDLSWEFIRDDNKKSIIIYCSATAKVFFDWLLDSKRVKKRNYYYIDKDYSYVKAVYFYHKNDLSILLDRILTKRDEEKAIVFFKSSDRLIEVYNMFKRHATCFCSESTSNSSLRAIRSSKPIKDNTFDSRFLLTTSALDNGVDLLDKRIKFIFCELTDVDAITQCLGRKRPIDSNDKCFFCIRKYDPRGLQGIYNAMSKKISVGKEYMKDPEEFISKHIHDRNLYLKYNFFYQGDETIGQRPIMLNKMMLQYLMSQKKIIGSMKARGYEKVVTKWLGGDLEGKIKKVNLRKTEKDAIMAYLTERQSKPIFKDQKIEIASRFKSLGYKMRSNSIHTLNGILKDEFPNYGLRFCDKDREGKTLRSTRKKLREGSINPNHGKNYWILTDDFENYTI